ncbi:unnamed protein product, partial [Tetraodon nigroviridis]
MDLHILDHRLRVTSISKNGLVHFTHPLIKLIFLRNRTRDLSQTKWLLAAGLELMLRMAPRAGLHTCAGATVAPRATTRHWGLTNARSVLSVRNTRLAYGFSSAPGPIRSPVWTASLLCGDNAGWGTVERTGTASGWTPAAPVSLSQAPAIHHGTQRTCKFFSLTETPENYTVVLDQEGFKGEAPGLLEPPPAHRSGGVVFTLIVISARVALELPGSHLSEHSLIELSVTDVSSRTHSELQPSEHLKVEGSTWLPLNVVSNGNASCSSQAVGVTKIAKSVIAPLAQQHVSVFMLSTYQTDFILVRESDLTVVISTLEEEFSIFKEVGGESVPVHSQDVSDGLQKNGREAIQPTVHPVLIPQNQFCVMSLDPATLPSIATTLIDVLFYSNSPKEEEESPSSQVIKFFSFSLIDGYISLVMDAQAQRRFPADLLFTSSSGELWRMVRIGGQPLGFGETRLSAKCSVFPKKSLYFLLILQHIRLLQVGASLISPFFSLDECGIVAQISQPLAESDISAYYISTFSFDHALV